MAQLLSQVAVGSIVKLNESGSPVNYIVVHQGNPDTSKYDASCNGAWLLRQTLVGTSVWDAGGDNAIERSDINDWLNDTMLSRYDSDIQNAIKQVKVPYKYMGDSSSENILGSGLSCKIFLLAGMEVGFQQNISEYIPNDGTRLDYFLDGIGNSACDRRRATLNGGYYTWWLRSPTNGSSLTVCCVQNSGLNRQYYCDESYGVRPAFIMDGATTYVLDDGTITLNQPPTAPGSITVPTVAAGQPCAITWTAATDPDGTIASYTLERSVNGSGWTQVFSGNALTYTDTIGSDWGTVAYRVCAVDNDGVSGPYATSETQTVQDGILYISGPASAMGYKVAPFAFEISTGVSGSQAAVSDIAVEISLDGNQIYSSTVDTGEEISVTIDTRTIGGGSHTIEATASKTDYISAAETYTFTTPSLSLPDGGLGVQLQDEEGRAVFPQSVASLIGGLYGKSVAGNLQQLAKSVLFNRESSLKYQQVTVSLADAQEGDIVQLEESGRLVDFYVAKLNYESTLNGTGRTLLVRKNALGSQRAWDNSGGTSYASATADSYLNENYKASLGSSVQSGLGTTEFYYTNSNNLVVTLGRAVFLLSLTEYGLDHDGANTEGTALPNSSTLINAVNDSGQEARQWTRSKNIDPEYGNNVAFALMGTVVSRYETSDAFAYYRPAFTLPSNFSTTYYVDANNNVYPAQETVDGGTFTDFFGNSISVPQVEIGSYVGTGTYGSGAPSELTFGFMPKAVWIVPAAGGSNPQNFGTALWIQGCTGGLVLRDYDSAPTGNISNITWTDNGLQWIDTSATGQLNVSGVKYLYFAIG